MINWNTCQRKYGDPRLEKNMILWDVPEELQISEALPKVIYLNKDLIEPLSRALTNLKENGLAGELKSWDGCFNVRMVRGSTSSMSLHSWGVAVDVNASENGLGQVPQLSPEFVACFTAAGFDWGGNFTRKDGMHFQLSGI